MGPKPRSIDHGAVDVENSCLIQRKKVVIDTYSGGGRPVTAREMRWPSEVGMMTPQKAPMT